MGVVEERLAELEVLVRPTAVLYVDVDSVVLGVGGVVREGVPALLGRYAAMGWRVVGVANRGDVALGLVSSEDAISGLEDVQEACGGVFDRILSCPHHPDADTMEGRVCWCRMPGAGMVVEAALGLRAEFRSEVYWPHLALFVGWGAVGEECARAAAIEFLPADVWRAGVHIDELEASP